MKINPFKAAAGFLVLFLSIILLLTTSGITSWSIWLFVWQFWPMLFIIFGAALIMRRWRFSFYVGIPIFIILFSIVGGGLWLTWKTQYFSTDNFAEENIKGLTVTKVSNELPPKINKADVKIVFGASKINVNALPDANSPLLYYGNHNSNFFTLNQRLELVGDKANISFKSSPFIKRPFSSKSINELDLGFSQKPEYSFDVQSGASDIDLNFEKLKVKSLDIDAGASEMGVKLGDSSNTDVKIKSGASSVKLYIPKNSGVKVMAKSALGSNNFSGFGLTKKGKAWESSNWEDAKNKITIQIDSGVSKVELAY